MIYTSQLIYILFFLISFLFVLLWAIFFFFYSPRKTTPGRAFFFAFLLGVFCVLVAFLFENFFLSFVDIDLFFLKSSFSINHLKDIIQPFFFSFFFVSVIEEIIKFIVLKKYISTKIVDQVIDGMKIGLWLGLGFAFLENIFYFLSLYSQYNSDGLVTIKLYREGNLLITATDNGKGCAPITAPGKVGIRGDNANFMFDEFTVTAL